MYTYAQGTVATCTPQVIEDLVDDDGDKYFFRDVGGKIHTRALVSEPSQWKPTPANETKPYWRAEVPGTDQVPIAVWQCEEQGDTGMITRSVRLLTTAERQGYVHKYYTAF